MKCVMNGSYRFHAFLLENGTVRMINRDESVYDVALKSEIITINSGNSSNLLFVVNKKMRAYEIINKKAIRVTGLPAGIKIKDISCGGEFTVFLSDSGRAFGMGRNLNSKLGLPRRIKKTEIPTEITFPNQNNPDKNEIIITVIHASELGWVALDSKQRAWIIAEHLMQSVRSDYKSMDPCIGIAEKWYFKNIRITQIKCGFKHAIALDTEGRVYWFGRFNHNLSLSHVSSDPIPFSHQITSIRSGVMSVACKDATNEWYIWGYNSYNHITGLCGCEAACKETKEGGVIPNPMQCKWQNLFDASCVIDVQLGLWKNTCHCEHSLMFFSLLSSIIY